MFYVNEVETKLPEGKTVTSFEFSSTPKEGYVQVFETGDFYKLKLDSVVEQANELWNEVTKEYVIEHGDGGSCVLGAGIEVLFIPKKTPKLRDLKRRKIIDQPRCCQGSCNWEGVRLEIVLDFLKENGIHNPKYNPGWLD